MKSCIALAGLLSIGVITGAEAASDVSARYDGVFSGTAIAAPGMGAASCMNFDIGEVTIAQGFLHTIRDPMRPVVTGFITEEGYLAAHMTRPGRQRFPMDGRMEDDVIVAGYIDSDADCYWVVRLRRNP